ncbi:MAG TPA: hypothetical protein PKZ56_01180 [Candidatus Paceibacterota bacterium]|nr:hypothetical protein [Candidatus Paceibacterota bacterium]
MDDSTKKLLNETYRISQENQALLKKIDRRQRYSIYWRALLFIAAVASALGVYYYFQPYVDQVVDIYDQAQSTFSSFIPQSSKPGINK